MQGPLRTRRREQAMTVALTGVGLVSPLGGSLAELADAIRTGRVTHGTRATGFEARAQVPARRARRLSRLALMTLAAARAALADAKLEAPPDRTCVVLGT